MLYLLLGQDDFSKREYLQTAHTAAKAGEIQVFLAETEGLAWSVFLNQDLFSKPKTFVVSGGFKFLEKQPGEAPLEALVKNPNLIFLLEEKLDKRGSLAKKLLGFQGVVTEQFDLPHLKKYEDWIQKRSKALGGVFSVPAAEALAKKLGRDDFEEVKVQGRVIEIREVFSLWQTDSEIRKLLSLASGREVVPEDVENLVHAEIEVDSIAIANAIADNDRVKALALVESFLRESAGADQKAGVIQLSALLSEQFRNIAIVQDLVSRRMPEAEILEKTGWKPGRLFVMKKIAGRFPALKVWQTLAKLEALDTELKTSSTPPRVLLDLILSQLLLK